MRAAVRALNREEAAVDDWLRRRVEEALADPGRACHRERFSSNFVNFTRNE
jgi:hypothetical protein